MVNQVLESNGEMTKYRPSQPAFKAQAQAALDQDDHGRSFYGIDAITRMSSSLIMVLWNSPSEFLT